jgi:hypothetical protein
MRLNQIIMRFASNQQKKNTLLVSKERMIDYIR